MSAVYVFFFFMCSTEYDLTDFLCCFRTDIREREFEEEEREELLGSDDEEQEDPFDYCKGE